MKIVIKIGGQAAEDRDRRRRLAGQIMHLRRSGHHVVVVHGGGKALTQTLERLAIPTEFHNGLRVTNAQTRDVALMVLGGSVNKQWVAELETLGQAAIGICGGDGKLVIARKLSSTVNGSKKDLGFVGRPSRINTAILDFAFAKGFVPVVASLGLSSQGEYLNINADDLAASLASALEADRLVYLTESGGVWDADRKVLPLVRLKEIRSLIQKGTVRDGMIPKLRSCARTLQHGVQEIDIISPDVQNSLLRTVIKRESVGTRIVKTG
ncbi:MAG: acetylglutamate kinase [Acidobacteria bacterium]|nr:acetylglutamate kinase [Acidobacteriota bacterium]